jgi:hypothetical protein
LGLGVQSVQGPRHEGKGQQKGKVLERCFFHI